MKEVDLEAQVPIWLLFLGSYILPVLIRTQETAVWATGLPG